MNLNPLRIRGKSAMYRVSARQRRSSPKTIAAAAWIRAAILGTALISAIVYGNDGIQAAALSADDIHAFAIHSYENGDFQTAAIEFKRFVFYFPEDSRAPSAALHAGMSYYRMQRYAEARDDFFRVLDRFPGSPAAIESRFMLSRCQVKLNDPAGGVHELRILLQHEPPPEIRDRAYHQMGWIHLEAGQIAAARGAFENIRKEAAPRFKVDHILRGIDEPGDIPRKRPEIAGILAIVPGAGYLYCGRYKDAVMAFFLSGALGVAAYESFDKDLHATGALLGLVGAGFYGGSIWGSISSAHKYNKRVYDAHVDTLKQTIQPDLSFQIGKKSISLAFQVRF